MNIAVIGMGLIGGSLCKSIKSRTLHSVFGYDADEEVMMLARLCGAMDERLSDTNIGSCDVLLIAVRPGAAVRWIEETAKKIAKGAVVCDMCGVKRSVFGKMAKIAEANGFSYVGCHPMAGRERSGFVSSTDDLFDGASMIITPVAGTDMNVLESLKDLYTDIGFANMTYTTPEEHDRMIAYTSQLAHVASGAYVKSPEAQNRRGFSAGSFRDMTRVARLDENMWTELMMDNADNLSSQLGLYIDNLQKYKDALDAGDSESLRALLREGREKKAAAGGN